MKIFFFAWGALFSWPAKVAGLREGFAFEVSSWGERLPPNLRTFFGETEPKREASPGRVFVGVFFTGTYLEFRVEQMNKKKERKGGT